MGPMQIFADADEFRKTLYKYSVGNKFEYTYVKNSKSKVLLIVMILMLILEVPLFLLEVQLLTGAL